MNSSLLSCSTCSDTAGPPPRCLLLPASAPAAARSAASFFSTSMMCCGLAGQGPANSNRKLHRVRKSSSRCYAATCNAFGNRCVAAWQARGPLGTSCSHCHAAPTLLPGMLHKDVVDCFCVTKPKTHGHPYLWLRRGACPQGSVLPACLLWAASRIRAGCARHQAVPHHACGVTC
jgi:hypothetical protein